LTMLEYSKLFIGGQWVSTSSARRIEVHSPHSHELIGSVPDADAEDVDRAVTAARDAFDNSEWRHLSPAQRAEALDRLREAYVRRIPLIAELHAQQMGCPIRFAKPLHAQLPVTVLDYYRDLAHEFSFKQTRPGVRFDSIISQVPVGLVGAIIPWNGPTFLAVCKLAPALLAGCTVVLKSSPEAPLDTMVLAEIAEEAELPPGVFNVVPGGAEAGESLVTHPSVDKIAFTGSTATGRRVAGLCGQLLKGVSLELGGKSAAIVLDDADINATMRGLVSASFVNNGQMCAAQTRLLVSQRIHERFVEALVALANSLSVGDPLNPATHLGPLVSSRQRDRVESYIEDGRQGGAKLVAGGGRPSHLKQGWYVEPTIFDDVDNSMRIAQEEIFGPVLCVIPFVDEEEAIHIANDTAYGLSGTVWTRDLQRGLELSQQIAAGTVGINHFSMDPAAPFGGFGASGTGRELGPEGLREFLHTKTTALPIKPATAHKGEVTP
jgi:aldehyde dehydrogenase (NAD+)